MPTFPRCLHGVPFRDAAAFAFDAFSVLLIAVDDAAARGGSHMHIAPLDLVRDGRAGRQPFLRRAEPIAGLLAAASCSFDPPYTRPTEHPTLNLA